MSLRSRIVAAALTVLGVVAVGVGIVYLTLACENLPGILGPHPGDTSPRTPRGVAGLVLGLALLAVALMLVLRRRLAGPKP